LNKLNKLSIDFGLNKTVIISAFFVITVILISNPSSLGLPEIQTAEAKKSAGTSLAITSSDKICGDRLCDEPMTTEEKIKQYLEDLEKKTS